jgi:hypothetical protein
VKRSRINAFGIEYEGKTGLSTSDRDEVEPVGIQENL